MENAYARGLTGGAFSIRQIKKCEKVEPEESNLTCQDYIWIQSRIILRVEGYPKALQKITCGYRLCLNFLKSTRRGIFEFVLICYKLIQHFRVTYFIAGQHNTALLWHITGIKEWRHNAPMVEQPIFKNFSYHIVLYCFRGHLPYHFNRPSIWTF